MKKIHDHVLPPRAIKEIWRDLAHGELLSRLTAIANKEGITLFSENFANICLEGAITTANLHHVFTGRRRLSPDLYSRLHLKCLKQEMKHGLPQGRLIHWWKVED